MSLLEEIFEAHGGPERWQRLSKVEADVVISSQSRFVWHNADLQGCPLFGRYRDESGHKRTCQHITSSFRQFRFPKHDQLSLRDEVVGISFVLQGISGAS
jgi:hypothetical protein